MVKIVEGDVRKCCRNEAGPKEPRTRPCGRRAAAWRVSWDVTGEITSVSPACKKHVPARPGPKAVRLWASHDVPRDVAVALADRADRD